MRWKCKRRGRLAHSGFSRSLRCSVAGVGGELPDEAGEDHYPGACRVGPDVIFASWPAGSRRCGGQQVLVINRPGGGALSPLRPCDHVGARRPHPLHGECLGHGRAAETQAKLPFSFDRDFVSIGLVGEQPFVIAVPPALKISTLAELIVLAKERPGAISYAANYTGTLPHMTGEFFRRRSGIDVTFVPYTGGAPAALNDIMGGRISTIVDRSRRCGAIQGGTVNALAVTSARTSGVSAFADMSETFRFRGDRPVRVDGACRNRGRDRTQGQPGFARSRSNRNSKTVAQTRNLARGWLCHCTPLRRL